MTHIISQGLQKVGKGTDKKMSLQTTARKVTGTVRMWHGVAVHFEKARSPIVNIYFSRHNEPSLSSPPTEHTALLSGYDVSVFGRRASLSCNRSMVDVITLWVSCPLWVSQSCQLSLPSLWGR